MEYHVRQNGIWVNPCTKNISLYKSGIWYKIPLNYNISVGGVWVLTTCTTTKINWTIDSTTEFFPNNGFLYEIQYLENRVAKIITVFETPGVVPQSYVADVGSLLRIQWNDTKVNLLVNGVYIAGTNSQYNSYHVIDTTTSFGIIINQK